MVTTVLFFTDFYFPVKYPAVCEWGRDDFESGFMEKDVTWLQINLVLIRNVFTVPYRPVRRMRKGAQSVGFFSGIAHQNHNGIDGASRGNLYWYGISRNNGSDYWANDFGTICGDFLCTVRFYSAAVSSFVSGEQLKRGKGLFGLRMEIIREYQKN